MSKGEIYRIEKKIDNSFIDFPSASIETVKEYIEISISDVYSKLVNILQANGLINSDTRYLCVIEEKK